MPTMMDGTRTIMFNAISQKEILLTPSFTNTITGDVKGKIVSTTQTGLLGNAICSDIIHSGTSANMEYIGYMIHFDYAHIKTPFRFIVIIINNYKL
jgi:hypothetical protein